MYSAASVAEACLFIRKLGVDYRFQLRQEESFKKLEEDTEKW